MMLQFFKKSGQKIKSRSPQSLPAKSASSGCLADGVDKQWTRAASICSLEEKEEESICENEDAAIHCFRSRLSKSLPEILADKNALGYFIQYIDSKDNVSLIKFWLEVECLCNASSAEKGYLDISKKLRSPLSRSESFMSTDSIDTESNGFPSDENYRKSHKNEPKSNNILKNEGEDEKRSQVSNTRQDAERIYEKYIAGNVLGPNSIPEETKAEIEDALNHENTNILLKRLSSVQKIVYRVLEDDYVNDFLRSSLHCKHQIDVLTSGNVQLSDVLYDDTAFFYFIEFMDQENSRELLDFWMSAVNYKQNLLEKEGTADPAEAQSDALIIYDKYFSLQATVPLGFSDRIRFQVEQNICREDGKGPQPDCFDKPCKIVYHFLNGQYLPAFLSSQLYYKYLSELICTIQNSICSNIQPFVKKADSDCGSEVCSLSHHISYCQKNDKEMKRITKNTSLNGNMNIDTKHLYDPDSLWKRNKRSLSVGYVDSMGRFITEIEPDPRRKYDKASRLSRAVKRLVNMEQDKTKEELAWKIAEMIVRDITSLTLGAPNCHISS